MIGIIDLPLFCLSVVILIYTPGVATLLIINNSMKLGKRSGYLTVLGIQLGAAVHIIAAVLGLVTILSTSELAYGVIKYIGALYLIYLGIQAYRDKSELNLDDKSVAEGRNLIYQGILTNVLNPKLALFFVAFIPQFINPNTISFSQSFLYLGVIFTMITALCNSSLVVMALMVRSRLKKNKRIILYFNKTAGVLFVLLGIKIVLG